MTVTAAVRRLGASVIGSAAVLALSVGCSSSTDGKGLSPGSLVSTAAGQSSTAATSLPTVTPSSAPVTLPSSSPVLGAGSSQFCKDLNGQGNLGNVGSAGDFTKAIEAWDKLAAAAPAEIKADVRLVARYLHGAASGKVDPAVAQKLSQAVIDIGTYTATHCR